MKNPPFHITSPILNASMEITRLLGQLDGLKMDKPKVILRKSNKIKTIQASLAIEGNTLSIEQVSDLLDGIPVVGPQKDILEAKNAITAYEAFSKLRYYSQADFKKSHQLMMKNLIKDAGHLRSKNVGVFAGSQVAHVAPQYKMVPNLITNLFIFLKKNDETSLLIKSCIFHYELEFIHPFSDGNGRMGRFWQHLILSAFHNVFRYIAIESLIKDQQKEYYAVLAECDHAGESTEFIEFSLMLIEQALQSYSNNIKYQPQTALDRLTFARDQLKERFSRKDYCNIFKNISTATASRDLKFGIENKLLQKTGEKRLSTYQFFIP